METLNTESNKPALELLKDYSEKGYLFHGSPRNIDILEPRTTHDPSGNKFNNDTAVFATPDIITPIMFGVVDRQKVPEEFRNMTWSSSWTSEKPDSPIITTFYIPEQWKTYVENAKGWVMFYLPIHLQKKQVFRGKVIKL